MCVYESESCECETLLEFRYFARQRRAHHTISMQWGCAAAIFLCFGFLEKEQKKNKNILRAKREITLLLSVVCCVRRRVNGVWTVPVHNITFLKSSKRALLGAWWTEHWTLWLVMFIGTRVLCYCQAISTASEGEINDKMSFGCRSPGIDDIARIVHTSHNIILSAHKW